MSRWLNKGAALSLLARRGTCRNRSAVNTRGASTVTSRMSNLGSLQQLKRGRAPPIAAYRHSSCICRLHEAALGQKSAVCQCWNGVARMTANLGRSDVLPTLIGLRPLCIQARSDLGCVDELVIMEGHRRGFTTDPVGTTHVENSVARSPVLHLVINTRLHADEGYGFRDVSEIATTRH